MTFISPELACGLAILALIWLWPGVATIMGAEIREKEWGCGTVFAIISGLLAYCVNSSKGLLSPEGERKQLILDWPDYNMLKDRLVLTCALAGLSWLAVVVVTLFSRSVSDYTIGIIVLLSMVVSLVSTVVLTLAEFTMKRIAK